MLKKLGIALLTLVIVLLAAGTGAYYWAKSHLWLEIQTRARAQGADLEKPELSLRWKGGARIGVTLKDLRGRLHEPLPLEGSFVVPRLEFDAEWLRGPNLVIVESLRVEGVTGDFTMESANEEPAAPEENPGDAFQIPKLEVPGLDRPELPVAVELRELKITTGEVRFAQKTPSRQLIATTQGITLDLQGRFDETATRFEGQASVGATAVNWRSQDPAGSVQTAHLKLKSLRLPFASENPADQPLRIQPRFEIQAAWETLSFQKNSRAKDAATLEIQDQGGQLTARAEGQSFQLEGQGRGLRASALKKTTDWNFAVTPVAQTENERRYRMVVIVPGLLDFKTLATLPVNFNPERPQLRAAGDLKVHTDLSLLVLERNPSPWRSEVAGKFDVELKPAGDVLLRTQMTGTGMTLRLQSDLNPRTQEVQASGFVSIHFQNPDFHVAGLHPRGRVAAPFKILLRQQRKFYLESELRLSAFSIRSPDLRIDGMDGTLPVRQAWAFREGQWQLSPKLSPNAFGRADFDSFEPLESRVNELRIRQLNFGDRTYGPISLEMKFEQNLLRSGSWSARVGEGEIEGALQADLNLENPRVGLLMRAFDVKLEELLPSSMFRSAQKSERGLAFRLGMDWDLGKATAVGRLDWTNINSTQVMQILDFLDPQFENKTFNQARMILAQAYPTRVQVEMRGPVADVRISTNLLTLPDVRNVAISPYLIKANEALYSSELYRQLRSTGTSSKAPVARKENAQ